MRNLDPDSILAHIWTLQVSLNALEEILIEKGVLGEGEWDKSIRGIMDKIDAKEPETLKKYESVISLSGGPENA